MRLEGAPSAWKPLISVSLLTLTITPPHAFGVEATRIISMELGGYRFYPDAIVVREGERVQLELNNTDEVTPHNFTLKDKGRGIHVSADVDAEKTETVEFIAPAAGTYRFYCDKKMILMKSHRDKGMQGTLLVKSATGDQAMRVLLVSANREQIPDPVFPLGLAYVAAAAQLAGHQVAVADLCFGRHPLAALKRQVSIFIPISVDCRCATSTMPPIGAPGETEASIRATCRTLRRMNPTAVIAMTGVRLYPGTPMTNALIEQGRIRKEDIGLLPIFYVEPEIADFLPYHLRQEALETGNWVLPGLAAPLMAGSQKILRALGISGPLWRLLETFWTHSLNRGKFKRPNTSWGIPHPRRKIV